MSKEIDQINIGIDLGTSYSSIAYYEKCKLEPEIVKINGTEEQIPSWVSFEHLEEGRVEVGYEAKNSIASEHLSYDSKKLIGRVEGDFPIGNEKWPFEVRSEKDGDQYGPFIYQDLPTQIEKERFAPEEISGIILYYLIEQLKDRFPEKSIGNVVVGVPCGFNARQRIKTEEAIKLAGINDFELINEPSAAILEYIRTHPGELKVGSKIVVIDFGGSSLDISCCRLEENNAIHVIGNSGNVDLGGNDFDKKMEKLIIKKLEAEEICENYFYEDEEDFSDLSEEENDDKPEVSDDEYKKRRLRLRKEAERIKIALSREESVYIDLQTLFGKDYDEVKMDFEITITREEFEKKIGGETPNNRQTSLVGKFLSQLNEICRTNRFERDVDLVLPIGGTCQIPIIRRKISEKFPNKIADDKFDGFGAVAKGCCIKANEKTERLFHQRDILFDKLAQPIGFSVGYQRAFDIFANKDETLPIQHRRRRFCTEVDNQKSFLIEIYSGESHRVDDPSMRKVTSIYVTDLPQKPAGEVIIDIDISVNKSGTFDIEIFIDGHVAQNHQFRFDFSLPNGERQRKQHHFNNFLPTLH